MVGILDHSWSLGGTFGRTCSNVLICGRLYGILARSIGVLATTATFLRLYSDGQYKTRTADYGLSIKHGLGYKTRTEHYGLGIKHEESFKLP